jgi:hypothetical protein
MAAQPFSSIHYWIEASMQKPGLEIVEHTQIRFHVDSSASSLLRFWRLQFDHPDDTATIDSIKVNDSVFQIPADLLFSMVSAGNDPQKAEDLLFTLPCAELLIAGNTNSIDFYYRLHLSNKSRDELPVPYDFGYAEYYPRLAFTFDSLLRPNQRVEAFHNYSLRITVPSDQTLLSEKYPDDSLFNDGTTTYMISSSNTFGLFWMAVPRISCQKIVLADDVETFVCAKFPTQIDNAAISQIDSSLRFYKNAFGELPYAKLNLVFTDFPPDLGGGVMLNFMFLPARNKNGRIADRLYGAIDNIFQNDMAPPHETAHLWWGSGIYFSDDWPAEALATYWSQEYLASRRKGRKDNILNMFDFALYRLEVAHAEDGANEKSEYADNYISSPGILRMLFNDIGKDRFTNLCQAFYITHRHLINNGDTLRRFLSDSTDERTGRCFSLWMDSGYSQNYAIDEIKSNRSNEQYKNRLCLRHTGKAYSSVIVRLGYADHSVEDRRFSPDSLCAEWTTPHSLNSVMIDPDYQILESARSDNGWPVRPRFYLPSINPVATHMKWMIYGITDEPAYNTWISPSFPSHSDRFAWTISANLLGKRSKWFLDKERGNHLVEAKIGYNDKARGVIYSAQYANGIIRHKRWGSYYKVGTERIEGHYNARLAFVYNRWADSFGNSWLIGSISGSRRQYYRLHNVEARYWPERKTFPITFDAAFFGHNSNYRSLQNIDFHLLLEKGVGPTSSYEQYSKMIGRIDMNFGIDDNIRLFIGELSDMAVQEQFDLATDGMIKSCPPFIYRTKHMAGIQLFMDAPLNSFINARFFMTGVSIQRNTTPFAECGIGVLLGSSNLGLILDMPFYANHTDFDGKHWNFRRARLQLLLFNNEKSPQLDFRIR